MEKIELNTDEPILLWFKTYEQNEPMPDTEELFLDFVANSPVVVPRDRIRILTFVHKDTGVGIVQYWEK